MTIEEYENAEMSICLAYLTGMIFPKLIEKKLDDGNNYIVASVNHNSGKVTEEELDSHYQKVKKFFLDNNFNLLCRANKNSDLGNITTKEGFSMLIKTSLSRDENLKIIEKKVIEINETKNENIKKFFIKGCFDGRGSFDKGKLIAVDRDKIYKSEWIDIFENIVKTLDLHFEPNNRTTSAKRAPQLRVNAENYLNKIDFFSIRRKQDILQGENK